MSSSALLQRLARTALSVCSTRRTAAARSLAPPRLLLAFQSPKRWFAQTSSGPSSAIPSSTPRSSSHRPSPATGSPVDHSDASPPTPPLPPSFTPLPTSPSSPHRPPSPPPPPRHSSSASSARDSPSGPFDSFSPPPPSSSDSIPVEQLSFRQRLTATEEDRELLRRALRICLVLMLVSLLANGVVVSGHWDRWMAALYPAPPASSTAAVTEEDVEDQAMVDAILAQRPAWLAEQRRLHEEQLQQTIAEMDAEEAAAEAALLALTAEEALNKWPENGRAVA